MRGQAVLHANKNKIKLTERSAGESEVAAWKKQGANNEAKSPTALSCVMNVELIYFPCGKADFAQARNRARSVEYHARRWPGVGQTG